MNIISPILPLSYDMYMYNAQVKVDSCMLAKTILGRKEGKWQEEKERGNGFCKVEAVLGEH